MGEYLFDAALVIFGATILFASWWLLTHISDRRIVRRMRRTPVLVPRPMTHDEAVAQRSLQVAFVGIFLLILGALCLISGFLRIFGFGR